MYLLDTNIFLEILLSQDKKDICKKFIVSHGKECCLSDFTLYSIGIALFRKKLFQDYQIFFSEISSLMSILSLPLSEHEKLAMEGKKLKLDFDDLYQYHVAKYHRLTIVTMDKDFETVTDNKVLFL